MILPTRRPHFITKLGASSPERFTMQTTLKTARLASMARMMAGNPTSPLALRALAMIDPERVSSAPGIVGLFERSAAQAHGDKDLSDSGKAARVRSAADSRLMGLSTTAKELVALEKEHRQKQGEAMRRAAPPAADAAQAVIDVALAHRSGKPSPSLSCWKTVASACAKPWPACPLN